MKVWALRMWVLDRIASSYKGEMFGLLRLYGSRERAVAGALEEIGRAELLDEARISLESTGEWEDGEDFYLIEEREID